jgi:hypothetical protein
MGGGMGGTSGSTGSGGSNGMIQAPPLKE